MKRLILLFIMSTIIASCDKDSDNTVRYDEEKGYLTNIESVKFGIVGRWHSVNAPYPRVIAVNYSEDGQQCAGDESDEELTSCVNYKILQIDGKFIIRYYSELYTDTREEEI